MSGHVEATEVRLSAEVGGRLLELRIDEGARVHAGDVIARLDTRDTELAIARARAERDQADAQLRLLLAGSRAEDIRQAEAQVAATEADVTAARAERDAALAERDAARVDLKRFEDLLRSNSGSQKQRDDAATRTQVTDGRVRSAEERVRSGVERVRAARETYLRLKAGPRQQEIEGARARLAAVDAQIATLDKAVHDATVIAPSGGIVTQKLVEPGEVLPPRAPLAIVTDLDHAWANVYLDEPIVPRVTLGQPAVVHTDAGGPGLPGKVTYVASRAEFTPRNVQTAEERSKLVYRIKIAVDNSQGVLKVGMPVEAEVGLAPLQPSPVPAPGR